MFNFSHWAIFFFSGLKNKDKNTIFVPYNLAIFSICWGCLTLFELLYSYIFFSTPLNGEIKYTGALQKTNWKPIAIVKCQTCCHFSYRPNVFHNNMRNLKNITVQAILILEAIVREPSAVHTIRGTFFLDCLHKSFAITDEQNILKTLIIGCQSSFNNSFNNLDLSLI